MRRHVLASLAAVGLCAAALLLLTGCDPPVAVSADDNFFDPATATVNRGGSVKWTNNGFQTHTATGNGPLNLWDSGSLSQGESFTTSFVAGGAYPYFCSFHSFMNGSVRVPIAVSPTSGTTSTTFTITVASTSAPAGFRYIVQKKNPAGTFQPFRTITTASTTFQPTSPGTYQFRASLQRTSTSASSGFSAAVSINVS